MKKMGKIVIFVVLAVICLIGIVIVNKTITINECASKVFFIDETRPDTLKEKIEFLKYYDISKENEVTKEKYVEPVWDYFLNENKESDNYHTTFSLMLGFASFDYDICVDGDIAKVVVNITSYDEHGRDLLFEKKCEWYMVLEDDIVTSYAKNDEGEWVKTTRAPLVKDCVALNFNGILTDLRELELTMMPLVDLENKVVLHSTIPDPIDYSDLNTAVGFSANFTVRFDMVTKKLSSIAMGGTCSFDHMIEKNHLSGKDQFLDYLYENYTLDLWVPQLCVDQYEEVEVTLPEGVENAEEVENFGFMTEGVIEELNAFGWY